MLRLQCVRVWQGGRVLDVMQAGEKRVVLLTDRDVALLRVKFVALRSTFKPLWFVHLAKIQTVRGAWHPAILSRPSSLHILVNCRHHHWCA